jgi:hypothetical protein
MIIDSADAEYSEIYSINSYAGSDTCDKIDDLRRVLADSGIPSRIEFVEDPPDEFVPEPTHRWCLLVPGKLNMRATSVLDRDVFNDEFESLWRSHLEMLSDEELNEANPRQVFCGLFDRTERVVKAYNDELARRRSERAG